MAIPARALGAAWRREIVALVGWLVLWGVAGFLFDLFLPALLLALALYVGLHLSYIWRLHRWLLHGDTEHPPDGIGVWQEIFLAFYRMSQRSRKRKSRLKNIVNEFQASTAALPDGAVVLGTDGRIAWFNQAAGALLGFRSPHDVGQRIVNLIRNPAFSEYVAAHDYENKEVVVPSPVNDENYLALRIIPYGDGQRLLIARDVSEQKRLEATRRDFVANASHELRTPLTVLRGYLEMMEEETGHGGELKRWSSPIHEMGEQASRMGRIIEDLLKLARVEAEGLQQKQEVIDVPSLVDGIVSDARRSTTKAEQEITAEIDQEVCLYGRPSELESIFSNLIGNAIQYTPEGGDIRVHWWRDDEGVYFAVTDSGIGIDPKHIPRLTERFYRVDAGRSRASGGTGLGLAIVKHCLEHHDARLEIASEPNVGSTFTCCFPSQRAHIRKAA